MNTLNVEKLCCVIEKILSERDGSEVHVEIGKIDCTEETKSNLD